MVLNFSLVRACMDLVVSLLEQLPLMHRKPKPSEVSFVGRVPQGQSLTFFLQGPAGLPNFFSRGPAESLGAHPVFMPINVNLICNIVNFFVE